MRVVEVFILMPDGVRLAADLFVPDEWPDDIAEVPDGERSPAILEYLPYRKDEGIERDWDLYAYVVDHGYVGARVDIRGTGRSGGVLPDREYSDREWADGETVIAWLSRQPWCTGAVAMWGISWGGFNSIQMAMREPPPPALKAIVAVDASDMLFKDDVHYIDGVMHVDEYVIMIDLLNAMTAPPEFPTDEGSLAARFDREPWFLTWIRNQRDGAFWRRPSLAPGYERMRLPALLIGGWYDGYRDSVPRMLERCPGPVKAILGPWNHTWPHDATPGPEIEWRHEAVRWFDRWLRGEDNGVDGEPRLAVFVRDAHEPRTDLAEIPGAWRLEDGWPPGGVAPVTKFLRADGALGDDAGRPASHALAYDDASAGVEAGGWWGELRPDQAPFDARCLSYDTPPLDETVEIVGFSRVELRFALRGSDDARLVARLCDVAPDGASTVVTGAAMNASQRASSVDPTPVTPNEPADVAFDLHVTSWRFPAGHRIRLAISNACWPMLWPSPDRFTMELAAGEGGSRLVLPVVRPGDGEPRRPAFPPATPKVQAPAVRAGEFLVPVDWSSRREGTRAISSWEGESSTEFPWGTERVLERLEFEVDSERPAAAAVRGLARTDVELPGRTLTWQGELHLSTDEGTGFRYRYRRELTENGTVIRTREWEEEVPRDFQ